MYQEIKSFVSSLLRFIDHMIKINSQGFLEKLQRSNKLHPNHFQTTVKSGHGTMPSAETLLLSARPSPDELGLPCTRSICTLQAPCLKQVLCKCYENPSQNPKSKQEHYWTLHYFHFKTNHSLLSKISTANGTSV